MPTAVTEKTTNSSLPKIGSSSRNNHNAGTLTHSTKSQARNQQQQPGLNMSMSQEGGGALGEESQQNEDDNYEGDTFEYDENKA
jgi:hypothetical protein